MKNANSQEADKLISVADPGFLLGGGVPLRNDVTIQDFS